MSDAVGDTHDATAVLLRVLERLEHRLRWLESGGGGLQDEWRERCILQGRTVHLQAGTRTSVGLCRSIDSRGALILDTAAGPEFHFAGVIAKIE